MATPDKRDAVDRYIAAFPLGTRLILRKMRRAIREAAPGAGETMAYGIPTFRRNGYLVHYAAFAHHIGFYPTSSGIRAFKKDLVPYKQGMGSVQFPLDKPIPYDLVKRIVKFRVGEDELHKK